MSNVNHGIFPDDESDMLPTNIKPNYKPSHEWYFPGSMRDIITFSPGVTLPISGKTSSKETNPKDAIGATKLPMHLVSGIVKAYQAIAHFLGNVKYGAWNYRAKGARASVYRAAADRHLDAWWEGEDIDPVDGTPHLANALACINILIETSVNGKLVDDRPPRSKYREVVERMTALMPKIMEQYKDKNPIHYDISYKEDK